MKEITFENIGKGVSLYKFIEKYCLDQGFELGVIAMHRLCSLMRKMGVQTIIVEKMEHDDPDLQAECSSLLTYYAGKTEFKLYRLTFLSIWDYFIALRALALLLQLRDRKLPIYCQG